MSPPLALLALVMLHNCSPLFCGRSANYSGASETGNCISHGPLKRRLQLLPKASRVAAAEAMVADDRGTSPTEGKKGGQTRTL